MLNLLAAYEKRNTRQETSVDQDSFGFAGFDLHLRSAILTKPCASSQAVFAKRWAQTQNESADAAPTHILKITELMRNLSYTSTLAASPTIEYSAPQPKQRQTATALRKARPSATKSGKMLASFRLRLMLSPGKGIVQLRLSKLRRSDQDRPKLIHWLNDSNACGPLEIGLGQRSRFLLYCRRPTKN